MNVDAAPETSSDPLGQGLWTIWSCLAFPDEPQITCELKELCKRAVSPMDTAPKETRLQQNSPLGWTNHHKFRGNSAWVFILRRISEKKITSILNVFFELCLGILALANMISTPSIWSWNHIFPNSITLYYPRSMPSTTTAADMTDRCHPAVYPLASR